MNIGDAKKLTGGGLGSVSKMPGRSYSISASKCITGSKLVKIEGSVCAGCYALDRGNYQYPSVKTSHERHLASIAGPHWSAALAFLIDSEYKKACQEYIDLASVAVRLRTKQVKPIRLSRSKPIGYRNQTLAVGSGSARSAAVATASMPKLEVLNPAMYPLTLPRSGAIVELSSGNCTTNVKTGSVLIQNIWRFLKQARTTKECTPTSDATLLPDGLELSYFMRHHDSGDLQSIEHLTKICAVAALTPKVKHWLPTRELSIVLAYQKQGGTVPSNLVIRVSATMVDGPATKAWATTSTVHKDKPAQGYACPAPTYDNACGPCRKCWSVDNANTSYHKH
jgi:hypothetical protein